MPATGRHSPPVPMRTCRNRHGCTWMPSATSRYARGSVSEISGNIHSKNWSGTMHHPAIRSAGRFFQGGRHSWPGTRGIHRHRPSQMPATSALHGSPAGRSSRGSLSRHRCTVTGEFFLVAGDY